VGTPAWSLTDETRRGQGISPVSLWDSSQNGATFSIEGKH
jgi:hypothetical protein